MDAIHESIEPHEGLMPPEVPKAPNSATRKGIPNMQAKLRTQPSKRKCAPESGETESGEGIGGASKKIKVVIDLTGDD